MLIAIASILSALGIAGLICSIIFSRGTIRKLLITLSVVFSVLAMSFLVFAVGYTIKKNHEDIVWNPELDGSYTDVHFENGDTYTGTLKNGKMDGNGTLVYADGSVYMGQFVNNVRQGTGHYTDSSGYEKANI